MTDRTKMPHTPDPAGLLAKIEALHASLAAAHEEIARMHRATATDTDDLGQRYDSRHCHDLDRARTLIAAVLAESSAVGAHAGYLDPMSEPPAPRHDRDDVDDEIPF